MNHEIFHLEFGETLNLPEGWKRLKSKDLCKIILLLTKKLSILASNLY